MHLYAVQSIQHQFMVMGGGGMVEGYLVLALFFVFFVQNHSTVISMQHRFMVIWGLFHKTSLPDKPDLYQLV